MHTPLALFSALLLLLPTGVYDILKSDRVWIHRHFTHVTITVSLLYGVLYDLYSTLGRKTGRCLS